MISSIEHRVLESNVGSTVSIRESTVKTSWFGVEPGLGWKLERLLDAHLASGARGARCSMLPACLTQMLDARMLDARTLTCLTLDARI
jgi:hypothetical protein